MSRRAAGLILHPTSLPGPYGVGDLGSGAEGFLDWAAAAGQSIWQVLPLGPTGHGHSPYAGISAHAGNPLLIAPERLYEEGLLPEKPSPSPPAARPDRVDYRAAAASKEAALRASWEHFRAGAPATLRAELEAFRESPERAGWLETWTLFAAAKRAHRGAPWFEWESPLRRREPAALAHATASLRDEIDYQAYLQFVFFRQLHRLREAARGRGIRILGDVPIYLALDSADVWARPDLFQLDEDRKPTAVAGVPPDYFSATGQLWGNPLYDWKRHEAEGFAWWIGRVRAELEKFDWIRLDHFRGFASYWSVPAGSKSAVEGRWMPGPGLRLFDALRRRLGTLPIVAEDLGLIGDDVRALLRETGFPGMRVLHFGFDSPESEHAPDRIPTHCVAYTGTHDNDTTRGWYESLGAEERARVLARAGGDGSDIAWRMLGVLQKSAAERVIAPIQDVLNLGSEGRMNTPSVADGNWEFRVVPDALTSDLAARLLALTAEAGRLPA